MNLPHPKPTFLAPVVDSRGVTVGEQIAEAINALRGEHEEMLEAFRGEQAKLHEHAHARLEALESRWHERLTRWFRRQS